VEFTTYTRDGETMVVRGYARLDAIETDWNGNVTMTLAMVPGYFPERSVLTVEYPNKKSETKGPVSKHGLPQTN
jgi:hypothetical protein